MGAVWLGSLPQVLRDAGLNVQLWPGWETRSRSTGGYDAVWAIGVHHDAIPTGVALANRCRGAWHTANARPIGALWLHTDGTVVVGAAGATNTQGRGGPYRTSRGTIPLNVGNRYMLSIEASNNGVGEPWPTVQQDAYAKMCAALCGWLKLDPTTDVVAHFEWTSRKIDPAGRSKYASGGNKWDMSKFRSDVSLKLKPPEPEPGEDMALIAYVAKPPPTMPGNPPWMVVIDGAVRYMTNFDAPANLPAHELNQEQYDHLLKCANLEEGN